MSKRTAGVAFCAIAAFLYATRYLAAALFASSGAHVYYATGLRYVGVWPVVSATIALATGVAYLVAAERESRRDVGKQ